MRQDPDGLTYDFHDTGSLITERSPRTGLPGGVGLPSPPESSAPFMSLAKSRSHDPDLHASTWFDAGSCLESFDIEDFNIEGFDFALPRYLLPPFG